MQSKAATVAEYPDLLTPDRRSAINALRKVILKIFGPGSVETMPYGMIGPEEPLPFARLA